MHLYELGTRPWEAKDEEERRRIEIYEVFCKATVAANLVRDAQQTMKKLQKEIEPE